MSESSEVNTNKKINPLDISKVCYALYIYDTERLTRSITPENTDPNNISKLNDTVGFDLLSSDLTSEQECQLRLFLVRRLRKGAIYIGTGNFSSMDFSLVEESPTPAVCYYILLPCKDAEQENTKHIMICLIGTSEANLEAFRPELTQYCELIAITIPSEKDKELPASVKAQLCTWYNTCIDYVTRVIKIMGINLAALLELSQQNGNLEFDPNINSTIASDIRRIHSVCSIGEFLTPEPLLVGNVKQINENEIAIENVNGNKYCTEWAKKLTSLGSETSPWRLRKLLEAFKLKTIKDMNVLKRLLKQSETDHYSLYRAYSFLWQSGNSNVLLSQAKLEGSSESDIISVLEEHLNSVKDHNLQSSSYAL